MNAVSTPVWAIGLMTGTVLDGNIDVAMIRTDGETIAAFGAYALIPYEKDLHPLLERAVEAALAWDFDGPEPAIFAEAERALTLAQSAAIRTFLDAGGLSPSAIAVIGFHGQTVLHRPPQGSAIGRDGHDGRDLPADRRRGRTRQLGHGGLMAAETGIDVVYDFRSADMLAGGQGAPLAPVYHRALLDSIEAGPETAILNLGGVANITWRCGARLIAFDTGPANAPLNDWVRAHSGAAMDRDGEMARAGRVDEDRLAALLDHPFLAAGFPKSLDRHDFPATMVAGMSPADGAATLTAFTAAAVGRALDLLPQRPERLVVCGGGRRNPAMMDALAARSGAVPVAAEAVGLRGDAVEAECFAYLAVRALRGLPISEPSTTGVPQPLCGGRIARAAWRPAVGMDA